MTATMHPEEQPAGIDPQGAPDESEGLRRVLRIFVVILLSAAVGLIVLLFAVVRPERETDSTGSNGAGGYPIEVVKAVYGPKADDSFAKPLGVAFDPDGNVWVSDTGKARVAIVTEDGEFVNVIADKEGPGALSTPNGIAADPARERMYVADWTEGALLAYSTSGRFLERFPAADQDLDVFGAGGFTPYDVKLAGSNIVASSNDGLYFFDRTGHVVERWGSGVRGKRAGDFNFPNAFEVDNEHSRIYVADTLNRRIMALDFDGHVEWTSGSPDDAGKITGFWQLPRGIAMGPDGTILVVDTFRFTQDGVGTGHVVALSEDGALISEFGRAGDEEGSFNFPEKIAAGPDGLFAIADREHNRVLIFRLGSLPALDDLERDLYAKALRRPSRMELRHEVRAGSATSTTPTTTAA